MASSLFYLRVAFSSLQYRVGQYTALGGTASDYSGYTSLVVVVPRVLGLVTSSLGVGSKPHVHASHPSTNQCQHVRLDVSNIAVFSPVPHWLIRSYSPVAVWYLPLRSSPFASRDLNSRSLNADISRRSALWSSVCSSEPSYATPIYTLVSRLAGLACQFNCHQQQPLCHSRVATGCPYSPLSLASCSPD